MSNLNLPPEAIAAIDRGEWIEAIKLVREHTGLGLKEAKDAVERYRNGDRSPLGVAAGTTEDFDEAFAPPAHHAPVERGMRNVLADPMAEPGRVRSTFLSSPVFWLVLLAIAVIAWRFFKAGE
ncbi:MULTISPECIES: ribosomal protein L7/L12 [unclassified Variovorax]|uniref:ribosomal protein L7/L12 n=1 Tax=unclassified Variovorax TaxID=663243 RepID=UPI001BD535BF|nr:MULTISPECIES: ribosomal protein L7/L12 [unclassified Variovorax]